MNRRQDGSNLAAALQVSVSLILIAISAIVLATSFNGAAAKLIRVDSKPVAACANLRASINPTGSYQPGELLLTDRVAYQYAIEEVYWRHRIWPEENDRPKPALDEVISAAQVREKVERALRDSQQLADIGRAITSEQLQNEMERIARDTKQPDVLRELFAALNNDPALVAECLASPVLSERLVRELSGQEEGFDTLAHLSGQSSINASENRARPLNDQLSGGYTLPEIRALSSSCADDVWTATTTVNAPSARSNATAVWTGSEMIVWGGSNGTSNANSGGRYSPSTDSWTATSMINVPVGRQGHTAIWTGSEMIVWGGNMNTGGRYNPTTDSWVATTTTNAPAARYNHTAVWTGAEMIVWGGDNSLLNTGGKYNPSTDTWVSTSTSSAPAGRHLHTAVWTGTEMIIWGGSGDGIVGLTNSGGKYNPTTNSWVPTTTNNAPTGRQSQAALWTGAEMIVWGGEYWTGSTYAGLNTGGKYDPSTDSWGVNSTNGAPTWGRGESTIWTGSEMITWGGSSSNVRRNTGARYNPSSDNWFATTTNNAPAARSQQTGVWTGSEMIVWGGTDNASQLLATGGRYCAQPPTPTPTPATPTPSPAPTPSPTPTPTPPPPGITLVSRLSDAYASAHAAGDSTPPPQIQTDFQPANLSNSAAAPAAKGGTGSFSNTTSNSSIAVDNTMGTMTVTGNGMTSARAFVEGASASASADVIILNFALGDSAYNYSLTGQISIGTNCNCSASARARLTRGNSTIFDVVASPFVTLSQTGTLPPGSYTLSVTLGSSSYETTFGDAAGASGNFTFALNGPPASTPTPSPLANISGNVSSCSNPAAGPLPNVALSLTGSAANSTLSDANGNYTFSSLTGGGTYTVTLSKTALSSGTAGITTVDVIAVQRHYLNIAFLPPGCRLTAADVNGDSAITTVDVIAIQRFFLGLSTGLANVGKYQFSPASRSYPNLTGDQTNQNYDALVFGDVAAPFVTP